jgi:hypothetical protein
MVLRYGCRFRPRFMVPSSPAFWAAVTLMRPSDPASHHRRGHSWIDGKGCDHADGTPAACLVAGRADRIALAKRPPAAATRPHERTTVGQVPVGARYDIVRCVTRGRLVDPAQCQTRHSDGGGYSARQGRHRVGESTSWVEQPPGHGSDFVEELECLVDLRTVD